MGRVIWMVLILGWILGIGRTGARVCILRWDFDER
jgi:hypothetical protein